MAFRVGHRKASRRQVLGGAADADAGAGRGAQTGDPLIAQVQGRASGPGDGADATPYGLPNTTSPQGRAHKRHHQGAIDLRKQGHRLMLNGMVDRPLAFFDGGLEPAPRQTGAPFCEHAANTGMEWAGTRGGLTRF